jgi:hypothetical protein
MEYIGVRAGTEPRHMDMLGPHAGRDQLIGVRGPQIEV